MTITVNGDLSNETIRELQEAVAALQDGGGGGGLSEPLTSLLPLGKVTDAGPTYILVDGPQPVVFDPTSAAYSDKGWGWWEFQDNAATFWTAFGDIDADGACVINLEATADAADIAALSWNHSQVAQVHADSASAFIAVRPATGQTAPTLLLKNPDGSTFLQVLPNDGGGHAAEDTVLTITNKHTTDHELQTYWSVYSPDHTKQALAFLDVFANNVGGYAEFGLQYNGDNSVYIAADQGQARIQVTAQSGQTSTMLAADANDGEHVLRVMGDKKIGVYNQAPVVRPTVTGSRGGNAALASLLTALASIGWVIDSSS